jgi:hypothetical protein
LLAPACLSAQEKRPHSILVLDRAETRGPFYDLIFSGLRHVVNGHADSRVTIYGENLNRFGGPAYEQSLKRYLHQKYRRKPIGAIVAESGRCLPMVAQEKRCRPAFMSSMMMHPSAPR